MIFVLIGIAAAVAVLATLGHQATGLAVYARNAGFRGVDLITAVAVALAESGGNPTRYNPESAYFNRHNIADTDAAGMGSYGLWQIFRYLHPEFADVDLYDPQVNANAAYSVYVAAGHKFTPWSTFNGGQYTAHLDAANNEVNA